MRTSIVHTSIVPSTRARVPCKNTDVRANKNRRFRHLRKKQKIKRDKTYSRILKKMLTEKLVLLKAKSKYKLYKLKRETTKIEFK